MKQFGGRIAVVTGGGTGMGRELVRQLAAEGCHVAFCDVSAENMEKTLELAREGAPAGTRITSCLADVSDESQVLAFRDAVLEEHETDCVHLLINNAGISGGSSFLMDDREQWERTFGVCWYGVYYCCRAFLPLLVASEGAHLVNTSSVNGFWATLPPETPHTAYSSAKFAVKGFTEALLIDLRINAPHVKASLVMPGHVGTEIVMNSLRAHGQDPKEISPEGLEAMRARGARRGLDMSGMSDDQLRESLLNQARLFRDFALTTAEDAAGIILDGVRNEQWRILIGEDARALDALVRESPEDVYSPEFVQRLMASESWARGR